MSITVKGNCFKLDTEHSSYLIKVADLGYLMHQYYGPYVSESDVSYLYPQDIRGFSPNPAGISYEKCEFSLDTLMQEYSGSGSGDYRLSSLEVKNENGNITTDLHYKTHTIIHGKKELKGLPSTFAAGEDIDTLIITLEDSVLGVEVELSYSVFSKEDCITRSVKILNKGACTVSLEKVMSLCIDFPAEEYDFVHLWGGWANERQLCRQSVKYGLQGFSSRRGTSSHQHNPFFALCAPETTENTGTAYGFGLVYSGNHSCEIEKTQFGTVRCVMGINPDFFSWQLKPDGVFTAPEVIMCCSSDGLNGMSACMHSIVRDHLTRGKWAHSRRPILINNWEATYFNFDEKKILDIAKTAADLGIELMVLDDGWFGHRNDDRSSLGDWFVNTDKLPAGLGSLSCKIEKLGMKFGLWFEPEMISVDSELYKAHPDWILCQKDRDPSTGRNQLVLDFTREEVRNGIWTQMDAILKNAHISYIKWDMNRHLTEVGSLVGNQGECYHRYVLGVYALMEKLVTSYPDILLENCSGGGGRFDFGMMYYSPQIWCSDDTDAVERAKIQYGTSYCYPLSTMGSHISAVPNHQTGRVTPFKSRGDIAIWGAFGYELDLNNLDSSEKEQVRKQCAFEKTYGDIIHDGTFYRLLSPFENKAVAWAVESRNKNDIFILYMQIQGEANGPQPVVRLPFVKDDRAYRNIETGMVTHGSVLKNAGLFIPRKTSDYVTTIIHLEYCAE